MAGKATLIAKPPLFSVTPGTFGELFSPFIAAVAAHIAGRDTLEALGARHNSAAPHLLRDPQYSNIQFSTRLLRPHHYLGLGAKPLQWQ